VQNLSASCENIASRVPDRITNCKTARPRPRYYTGRSNKKAALKSNLTIVDANLFSQYLILYYELRYLIFPFARRHKIVISVFSSIASSFHSTLISPIAETWILTRDKLSRDKRGIQMTLFSIARISFRSTSISRSEGSCIIGDTKYVPLASCRKDFCISLDRGQRVASALRLALLESSDRKL